MANGISYGLWGAKSARERRRMQSSFDRVVSKETRQRMVWLKDHGWLTHEIAEEFNVTRRTVARHIALGRAS